MKKYLLSFTFLFGIVKLSFSQSAKESGKSTDVYIINDVKLSASTNNNSSKATSGTGSLGILFRKRYFYGSVTFNVINKNETLNSDDSTEVKLFTSNLLIPENSGKGISSFYIGIGWKSFSEYSEEDNWEDVNVTDVKKRIGMYLFWQSNNTIWTKDSVSTNISINSPGILATYSLLNLELDNKEKDKVYVSLFLGAQWRFLGGDFGLENNDKIRTYFIKKSKVDFFGTTFGAKLEFGKFFGKIQETYFAGMDDLPGFSGWQSIISIGANIDFNIKSKDIRPALK